MSANPISADPSFVAARELVAAGGLGQTLAVYAAIRARGPLPDPLASLGAPLLDELIATVGEAPESVTASAGTAAGGYAHWSLLIAFPSGLRATADIGAGLGPGQADALELRVEWSGTERAILVEPGAVGVTVTTRGGSARHSAEVHPLGVAILAGGFATGPLAAATIAAARASVRTGEPVSLVSLADG